MGVKDGLALPADTRGFISVGYDGTNTRFFRTDSNGHQYILSNQLPSALVGGRLDTNVGAWLGSTVPTVGQKIMASSIPIVIASDQSAIPVSQNGTWTVQQGTPPWTVAGTDADGAAPTQNPVLTAGYDGTNVQTELTDTSGRQRIVGAASDGAAVAGDPVLVGGQDGTNAQSLLTDTSGRSRIVGAGPEDSAKVGDPVRVAGSDGTNTRDLLTDSGGRQIAVGAAADGAVPVGNPVLAAGYDSTNVQTLLTDTSGHQRIVGTAADGAAAIGDPVQVAGVDDSANVQALRTETDGTLRTQNNIEDDRQKLVAVNFGKSGLTATTYYVFIDLDGSGYKHNTGTKIIVSGVGGRGLKSNSGAEWQVNLMVVLRIDGTDADLGILPIASVSLLDTSQFSGGSQIILFPAVQDLGVSGGSFTKITDGLQELNVTAVNTGTTFKDVLGNDVTPAVGDLLLRVTLISGGGTLDFVYGMDYWVE
jgi:hypothetical protein